MYPVPNAELALAALLIEAAIGYPAFVYRAIGHPVMWMGSLLDWLEKRLNHAAAPSAERRLLGVLALLAMLIAAGAAAVALDRIFSLGPIGIGLRVLVATSFLAQRSLHNHVRAVVDALEKDGLAGGRDAVSKIVGRDPDRLDEAGVARAAIESLAENFSDGIVAPAFWLAIAGLPGVALYKAINTADSMIGHRTPRYAAFGWAAARLDDIVNLPASRLAALFLVLGAAVSDGATGRALRSVWRDASRHRSPNAGWPEAAAAGALGLSLAGPRVYGDTLVDDAFMGDGRRNASPADIRRALRLYRAACAMVWLALLAILMLFAIWRG